MDLNTLLVLGLAATVALWVVTWARHPEMRGLAARGIRMALVGAIVVALVMVVLTTLFFNGRDFFGTISLGSAFSFGLVVGGFVGAGFFWLNTVILPIGLWFKATDGWAVGSVLATPVVVAAVGFGFTAYNAYQYQSQQPQVEAGTMNVELTGQRLGRVVAVSAADCQFLPDGGFHMDANLTALDGRSVSVQMGLAADGEISVVAVRVGDSFAGPGKGWDIGPDTTRLVNGWSHTGGQMELTDLVPLGGDGEPDPTERWSGSLSFGCGAP
jgi:hypothetical protein